MDKSGSLFLDDKKKYSANFLMVVTISIMTCCCLSNIMSLLCETNLLTRSNSPNGQTFHLCKYFHH